MDAPRTAPTATTRSRCSISPNSTATRCTTSSPIDSTARRGESPATRCTGTTSWCRSSRKRASRSRCLRSTPTCLADRAPSALAVARSAHPEPSREARAAERRRTVDAEFTAIGLDDVLHDGEADAVALHAFVAAHATLQQALDVLVGDAGTVVLEHEFQSISARAGQ